MNIFTTPSPAPNHKPQGLADWYPALQALTAQTDSYDLTQADSQRDMNRVEAKFVLPVQAALTLCERMFEHYNCLQVAGHRVLGYDTFYFDTEDYLFYLQHQQKKPRRIKVRVRHYRETDTAYLEVKRKDKAGATHKARCACDKALGMNVSMTEQGLAHYRDFLRAAGVPHDQLYKTLDVHYQRVSLRHRKNGGRLSLDFGLGFSGNGTSECLNQWVIAEIKETNHIHLAESFACIKSMGFRETSISKYCVGLAALHRERVKYNNQKSLLLRLGLFGG